MATTLGQVVYALPKIADAGDAPCTDQWTATTTSNAPYGRSLHVAVWTGSEMIVWGGGIPGTPFNTGGRYNPTTDSWTATSTTNAPSPRDGATAIWTGTEMIVWGGDLTWGLLMRTPAGDTIPARIVGQPPAPPTRHAGRVRHTAVWTGSEMIVWGGDDPQWWSLSEHRREISSEHGHLDSHQHHQRALWPIRSHGCMDWQ